MEGYMMKRKFILCSLMLCIASSSIHIDAWPSYTGHPWSHISSLVRKAHSSISDNMPTNPYAILLSAIVLRITTTRYPITQFAMAIAMHGGLFKSCQSMTYKDRLKQHILFFLYANLVSCIVTAIHESGHAIAATSTNRKVVSIEIDTNLRSFLTHIHGGRTGFGPMMFEGDSEYLLKHIFVTSMGPIFGLIGAYAMLRTYQNFETSAKKINPFDYFWKLPLVNAMLINIITLNPNLPDSDGSIILHHLKELIELYRHQYF